MAQRKQYYTNVARGGSMGKFTIIPVLGKDWGTIICNTEEEVIELESMIPFKQGRIWEITPEVIKKAASIPAVKTKLPSEIEGYNVLGDLFTPEQNLKISGLSEDGLNTIKDNVLAILELEFPTNINEKLNKEAKEKFDSDAGKPLEEEKKSPNMAKTGKGKLPAEEVDPPVSFQHLLKMKPNVLGKWVKDNQLGDLWAEYKAKKDVAGFVKKLEEENNA